MLRPQTWYLLLAAVSILVCLIAGAGTTLQVVLLIVAALAALAVIPLYKNRKLQASLTLLPMLALLAWYVVLASMPYPRSCIGSMPCLQWLSCSSSWLAKVSYTMKRWYGPTSEYDNSHGSQERRLRPLGTDIVNVSA